MDRLIIGYTKSSKPQSVSIKKRILADRIQLELIVYNQRSFTRIK